MLDLKQIKADPDAVARGLAKRLPDVDFSEILELDRRSRELIGQIEALRAERKDIARQIGQKKKAGEDSADLEARAAEIKKGIEDGEPELDALKEKLQTLLAELPNIPDEIVPPGGKENNQVVHTWGEAPDRGDWGLDHMELSQRLKLIDYERGVKIGGSGFWLYTGMGAALEWALLNYFCQKHFKDGYQFLLPPHMLVHECGYAAGQFPKFTDDVFHLQTDEGERDRFLLPTAETAILNVYRDEILKPEQLPTKCFAYTPCYRREAGSARTEERGMIRGHQFNKVEMFQFTAPEDGKAALDELVGRAQGIMEELGLHYRTSLLAAEDASASMALTYDIEVWLPSLGIYKEVASVSWARDYQARRANIRFKPKGAKQTEFIHTLNGSGLATSRLFPAILEQHQRPDGSVTVPEVLRPWLGVDVLEPQQG
ncbi:serine--tRNA ligase [Caenispirillum salinarum]|uniref:serine--tRNA ligase n=1 Tax=Caenispirillum salinarum TaxID=859058 RepID=UPI00384D447E